MVVAGDIQSSSESTSVPAWASRQSCPTRRRSEDYVRPAVHGQRGCVSSSMRGNVTWSPLGIHRPAAGQV